MLRLAASGVRAGQGQPRATLWQLFYLVEGVLLWDQCRRIGVNRLHAHFANVAADLCMVAVTLGGERWRWSFTMHGPTEFSDVSGFRLVAKAHSADRVICISDYCRSQLMRLMPSRSWSKLHVVHCGVDPNLFVVPPRVERAAGRLSVLCVGRLVPDKGQHLLVAAIAELAKRGLDVRVNFVGDGPDLDRLRQAAAQRDIEHLVHFAGAIGQDEISAHYEAADVFCLPSFAEGIPVVLMEAMSVGLPIITTRINGIPELVIDGVSGILIPPGRVDDLVEALADIAALDPRERGTMGAAGRRRVVEDFNLSTTAPGVAAALGYRLDTSASAEASP